MVETLKKAFMPADGSTTMTFKNEDEVLDYLGNKVLLPIWKDPVCGDGNCEWPWEFPSWGRFGCRAGAHSQRCSYPSSARPPPPLLAQRSQP